MAASGPGWSIPSPVSSMFFQGQSRKVDNSLGRKRGEGRARVDVGIKRIMRRLYNDNKIR